MKYDWIALKHEYVTGNISTTEIAKKYNIPYPTVRRQAEGKGWVKDRTEYRDALEKASREAAKGAKIDSVASFVSKVKQATESLIEDFMANPPRDMDTRAKVLKNIVAIGQQTYGLPTVTEQIARERLEYEKAKGTEADTQVEVVFEDERLKK